MVQNHFFIDFTAFKWYNVLIITQKEQLAMKTVIISDSITVISGAVVTVSD